MQFPRWSTSATHYLWPTKQTSGFAVIQFHCLGISERPMNEGYVELHKMSDVI